MRFKYQYPNLTPRRTTFRPLALFLFRYDSIFFFWKMYKVAIQIPGPISDIGHLSEQMDKRQRPSAS